MMGGDQIESSGWSGMVLIALQNQYTQTWPQVYLHCIKKIFF